MVPLSVEEEDEKGAFLDTLGPLGNERNLSYLRVLTALDPTEYKLLSGPCTSSLSFGRTELHYLTCEM